MLLALALLACSSDDAADKAASGGSGATGPTWHREVAPIVAARCAGCHRPDGASFDLTDPAIAASLASSVSDAVTARRMPPWGAFETDECTPTRAWADDRRLSEAEIETIQAWAAAGAPVGDPDDAAPAELTEPETLSGDVLELPATGSYSSRGGADEFVCLVVNPGNTEDMWIDGVETVPENRGIAHHTLVLLDPDALSDDLVNEDGWYDCGGDGGLGNPTLLATWVPGQGPNYAPEGVGMLVPAGSRIVLQMHYHPAGAVGEVDQPALRLRRLASAPERQLYSALLGNFDHEDDGLLPGEGDRGAAEFRIPAGSAAHSEEMVVELPEGIPEIPLVMVGAHMHLIGTNMSVWLERSTPAADEPDSECLLPASRYDYDWQQQYRYEGGVEDAPTFSSGDRLVIRCDYNNTLDNPGTARALADVGLEEPVDVYLGEGTLDEMCIGMFGYVY